MAPFSRAAEGSRLPDGNPNATVTLALTQKLTLVSDANGELDVTVLPTLHCCAMTTRGTISNGSAIRLAAAATADAIAYPTTVSTALGARFDTVGLQVPYSKYRIVSYGARLRNQVGLDSTGEWTTAVLPIKGMAPSLTADTANVLDAAGTAREFPSYFSSYGPRTQLDQLLASLGLPYAGSGNAAIVDITKIVNVPQHAVSSHAEVSARGLHFRAMPFEADARSFRSFRFGAVGTDSIDLATLTSASDPGSSAANRAVQQFGVDMSCFKVGGHESIILGASGCPANTNIGTLELIYHLEATPNPSYSLLVRPTSRVVAGSTGTATLDAVLQKVHPVPRISFSDVVARAGDALLGDVEGRVGSAVGSGLGSLVGMLGRLAIAAV